jgi:hypothetical protein
MFTGEEVKNKVSTLAASASTERYKKASGKMTELGLGSKFQTISSGALETLATKLTDVSTHADGKANA